MSDINKVILVGRLPKDMELSYTQSSSAIGKFSLAVGRRYKKGESVVDESFFFDCTLFGKSAEALKQYLRKGKQVAVEGSLKQDRWEKDGQKHSRVSIICSSVQLLGGKQEGSGGENKSEYAKAYEAQEAASGGDEFPEDIPF